jgi:archaellum component FlaF (FlaF/FlaG flagellin family)
VRAYDYYSVSVDSAGNLGNSGSYNPSISADGRFVAFTSDASNIVPGDTNNTDDIFVRDTLTNTTTRVSVDSAGNQGNRNSDGASISADGRFVAFHSDASNIVPGDTNNTFDIFVRDRLTNTTTRVSVDSAGNQGNSRSVGPPSQPTGGLWRLLLMPPTSCRGILTIADDIFVRDRLTNTTTRVSVDSAGNQANSNSFSTSISADGRFVAFSSSASNIVPGDTNDEPRHLRAGHAHQYHHPRLCRLSRQSGERFSYNPSISADGRFVAFIQMPPTSCRGILTSSETSSCGTGSPIPPPACQ